ncbi:MAG: tRNA dihydrouridine synthase DusB [Pseudomonadota bacterium]
MPENSSSDLSKPLLVGNVTLRNRAFLAPMSGVTDAPFRKLAWDFGAGLVVSEMVASQALMEGEGEMLLKLKAAEIPLHVVQLAGREAKWMALAAQMTEANGAHIIDINMGCPAKRVTTGYSGSALMRDLDHAMTLVDAVVGAATVPVTLKMRLGWDDKTINAPELAKRARDAGVQMITVHGRTRCQFYKGNADWNAVKAVKDAIDVPLVVNGDISGPKTAQEALDASCADAVMVGRAAYGAPWLPAQVAGQFNGESGVTPDFVKKHHEAMLSFYGIQSGIRQARKHLGWYLEGVKNNSVPASLKLQMMTSLDPQEVHSLIDQVFNIDNPSSSMTKTAA